MNPKIYRLQRELKHESARSNRPDFDPGDVDGIAGTKTTAAFSAWQAWADSLPHGPDVALWQVDCDWPEVKASGASFAYTKATQGLNRDPRFTSHWTGIKAAGLLRGAYHWLVPGVDILRQAEAVFACVGKLGDGDLPVALDVERDAKGADKTAGTADDVKATDAQVEQLADCIHHLTGKRPLVYSYQSYLDDRNIEVPNCGLWIARYEPGPPSLPPGWLTYRFHQYAGDGGKQRGIKGPCDQSRFRGTLAELQAL